MLQRSDSRNRLRAAKEPEGKRRRRACRRLAYLISKEKAKAARHPDVRSFIVSALSAEREALKVQVARSAVSLP